MRKDSLIHNPLGIPSIQIGRWLRCTSCLVRCSSCRLLSAAARPLHHVPRISSDELTLSPVAVCRISLSGATAAFASS